MKSEIIALLRSIREHRDRGAHLKRMASRFQHSGEVAAARESIRLAEDEIKTADSLEKKVAEILSGRGSDGNDDA